MKSSASEPGLSFIICLLSNTRAKESKGTVDWLTFILCFLIRGQLLISF